MWKARELSKYTNKNTTIISIHFLQMIFSLQIYLFCFLLVYWDITDILEKAMAPHSSTLAWKIPLTEEPGRLQSMGSLRVGHDWATSLWLTPVFLPRESQGWGSLVGCTGSLGSHRVRHDWSDLAAAPHTQRDSISIHWYIYMCYTHTHTHVCLLAALLEGS